MRVLSTVSTLAADWGGPPVVAKALMQQLAALGHRVGIMLPETDHQLGQALQSELGCRVSLHPVDVRAGPFRITLPSLEQVGPILRDYDAVVCHELWSANTLGAIRHPLAQDRPHILYSHGAFGPRQLFHQA